MSFQVKKFNSIVASMINWVSSSTDKITDFNTGSVVRTLLEAIASELEELYYQLLKAVEEAIEEAIYRTFNFPKNPAERSTGTVTFTRLTGYETTIQILLGTLISTDSSPPIYFETLELVNLPVMSGNADRGGSTTLVDSTKDWVDLGVNAGTVVKNLTDGGEATVGNSVLTGTAQAGSSDVKLIDSTKNFSALDVTVGSVVLDITQGSVYSYVTSVTTTTNPFDTLNFAALSGGVSFVPGDLYEIQVSFYSTTINPNDTLHFPALSGGASFAMNVGKVYFDDGVLPVNWSYEAEYREMIYFPVWIQIGFYIYVGFDTPRDSVLYYQNSGVQQDQPGILSGEYWMGSAWAALSYFSDGSKGVNTPFSIDGTIGWAIPEDWTRYAYQGFSLFWVRFKSDSNLGKAVVSGTATGGGATSLIDTTKNFPALGVVPGNRAVNLTDGGAGLLITSLTGIDTLNFASGSTFGAADSYRILTEAQGDAFLITGDEYKVIVMGQDVSAQCTQAGEVGNVAANTIIRVRASVGGVNNVTNAAAFSNGLEEETDSARKARFAYYIQSLARATKGALEYAAKTVTQVVAAKAIDDNRPSFWRYDANSATYTDITQSMRNPGDAAVNLFSTNAPGTGTALYIGGREVFDYINLHLFNTADIVTNDFIWEYWDGIIGGGSWQTIPALVDGTDAGGAPPHTGKLTQSGTVSWTMSTALNFWVASDGNAMGLDPDMPLRMWTRLRITSNSTIFSSRPTGDFCSLPPGLGYVYLYCHDGSGLLPTSVKTAVEAAVELYRGCGITVTVLAPILLQPQINVNIWVLSNYDMIEIAAKVKQYLIDWLSTKVLGEDLFVAEVYHKVMGLNEKAILNCEVLLPASDVITPSSTVIRPSTALITVTPYAG